MRTIVTVFQQTLLKTVQKRGRDGGGRERGRERGGQAMSRDTRDSSGILIH